MSRIGKKPIDIPSGVNVEIAGTDVKVKGPKGQLTYAVPSGVSMAVDAGRVLVSRDSDKKEHRALHGLSRSIVSNMVTGVSAGYTRVLEIKGVGYRAQVKGNAIAFTLGYSHPVVYELPQGITATADDKQTTITLQGFDKALIGQVAANIRSLRAPDIYKGKGLRYAGERLKLKAGKTGKK